MVTKDYNDTPTLHLSTSVTMDYDRLPTMHPPDQWFPKGWSPRGQLPGNVLKQGFLHQVQLTNWLNHSLFKMIQSSIQTCTNGLCLSGREQVCCRDRGRVSVQGSPPLSLWTHMWELGPLPPLHNSRIQPGPSTSQGLFRPAPTQAYTVTSMGLQCLSSTDTRHSPQEVSQPQWPEETHQQPPDGPPHYSPTHSRPRAGPE